MGNFVTQQSGASAGASLDLITTITARHALQVGDLLVGSHYDAAPKPLFPRSLVPASFATAKAPEDSIWSALTTATLSTSHNQMSVCPTAAGGFAALVGSASSAANVSLFVFGPNNTLLSNTTPISAAQVSFNNGGDNNFSLAELTNGGFVMAWVQSGVGYIKSVYPLGGGTPFGPTSLGTSSGVAVCAASDGGFYVYLSSLSKYNAAGVQQWTKAGIGGGNRNRAVIELANGNVAAVYGNTFAICSPSGAVVVAATTIPGMLGNESTAAALAGGGFVVASRTNGGSNFQHTVLSDSGAVMSQTSVPSALSWLRSHPAGGYVADNASSTTYLGFSNGGRPSAPTPGAYMPLPLADGRIASIRLNSAASQLVTEIFAGSGFVFGVALDAASAGASAKVQVAGIAPLRSDWNNGGFNHTAKSPSGTRGVVLGQSALLGGF